MIAFRADASLQIGTGHVMRCLTLADALAASGADCQFICRTHEGNLIEFIRGKGYIAHALPIAMRQGRTRPRPARTRLHPISPTATGSAPRKRKTPMPAPPSWRYSDPTG